ncbi:MAG: hypothetical protein BroJett003_12100 [Planctomycetota bacterium]|nr:MAG: hypothetical protein BroJett003_12100 [Planctomycetota bacterium]
MPGASRGKGGATQLARAARRPRNLPSHAAAIGVLSTVAERCGGLWIRENTSPDDVLFLSPELVYVWLGPATTSKVWLAPACPKPNRPTNFGAGQSPPASTTV